jgi:hypothetical protein
LAKTPTADDDALLAGLRAALAGPRPVSGKGGLFPATAMGRGLAQAAVDRGYLVTGTESVPPARGKGAPKPVVVAELTEAGRRHVLGADSPRAVLESLLGAVNSLASPTPPPVGDPRPELERATAACVRAIEDGFARLQKSVEAALARLDQAVVKALPAGPPIDPRPVLAAIRSALDRIAPATPGPAPAGAPGPRSPETHDPPAGLPDRVRAALREAYDELCLYVEFRDRLVELPRLYHEAARRLPGLTPARFHRELEALSAERRVELHKLNEVHRAQERDLAIERDGRLYYYVFWK